MIDADCYLPHSFIVDDEGAIVEDATLSHDLFYRTTHFRNVAWLIVGMDCS